MHTSNATISNRHFINNGTAISGGAISTSEGTNLTVDKCTFSNNGASSSGAVLYSHTQSNTTVINSVFTVNKANQNGVLMADNKSSIDLKITPSIGTIMVMMGESFFLITKARL